MPAGVVHLGGGPERFLRLLRDQVERRDRREPPRIDRDAGWTLAVTGIDPRHERAHEALLSLVDGCTGTRAAPLRHDPAEEPGVRLAGRYAGTGAEEELIEAPSWRRLEGSIRRGEPHERALDLRTGVLAERIGGEDAVDSIAFASLRRPGVCALRAAGRRLRAGPPLSAGAAEARLSGGAERTVLAAAAQDRRGALDRVAVFAPADVRQDGGRALRRRLGTARRQGFDRLLCEQRAAWGERWHAAGIRIEGDDELQLAVRVALYHLMGAASDRAACAIGARGATGAGYRGHVFWDTDVFVLPFLAATHPAAARAVVGYRHERLAAARAAARAAGRAGARFPWESASDGADVTPRTAVGRSGAVLTVENGALEEHIVADVAWAAATYAHWTCDRQMAPAVARILRETARWWASRVRESADGRAHIDRVIGPDEYHIGVDDNAFTNVMARWNLRQGAAHATAAEAARFTAIAGALVDGYDPRTGLYEQFTGFFGLEPVIIAELSRRPIAADLLLGRSAVAGAQIVKQADVLMLHHLIPDETEPGSLLPNLDFYEPRTAHGSSLSPGVHAALNARAGRIDRALDDLRLAARIDLDDLTSTTSAGVHLAAMGSVWQALAGGLCGLRAERGELLVDPILPASWRSLELPVQIAGRGVRIVVDHAGVAIEATGRVTVRVGPERVRHRVPPGGLRLRRSRAGALEAAP